MLGEEINKADKEVKTGGFEKKINLLEEELTNHYKNLGKKCYEQNINNLREKEKELFSLIEKKRDEIQKLKKQINTMNGISICEKCGQEVPETSIFCPECGNRMRQIQKNVPSGYRVCNHCNGIVKEDVKFCNLCGYKVENDNIEDKEDIKIMRCKQCGQVLEPGEQFCFNCGTRIENIIKKSRDMEISQPNMAKEESRINNDFVYLQNKHCLNCGKPIENGSLFCIYCGTKVK